MCRIPASCHQEDRYHTYESWGGQVKFTHADGGRGSRRAASGPSISFAAAEDFLLGPSHTFSWLLHCASCPVQIYLTLQAWKPLPCVSYGLVFEKKPRRGKLVGWSRAQGSTVGTLGHLTNFIFWSALSPSFLIIPNPPSPPTSACTVQIKPFTWWRKSSFSWTAWWV